MNEPVQSEIKIDAFKFAVNNIDDGWLFESFAQSFLSAIFNYEFIPVGGTKDRGIDGLEHTFSRKGYSKRIYQISTEKDAEGKIKGSIEKLKKNDIKFDTFTFVTNREIRKKDNLIDTFIDTYSINVQIFDLSWFVANANANQGTRNAYFTFIQRHMHEYNVPGKSFIVSGIETDSRIFVFLRQQLESKWSEYKIDDLLADSLILFALEGTDPDKDIFKTKDQIKDSIKQYVKFDAKLLDDTIEKELNVLSTKPRKIKFHKGKGYCLPFETRLEITQRNLSDKQLINTFYDQTSVTIRKYLQDNDVAIKNMTTLIDAVVHKIFHQQGLEFSNFILHGKSQKAIDKDLQETINKTVDESTVVEKNKEKVKSALQVAIREIVYHGTVEQRQYFKSLSNTYMMMFLLQWNPQVALYFESMASKLSIYVCTSIIVPALSEFYLETENKRHWNLLKACQTVGIRLNVNDEIIEELIHHLNMVKNKYETLFSFCEDVYLMSELETLFIDEVLIRAYFHAKARGKVKAFNEFIDNFCDPSIRNVKQELIDFLNAEFGINYISNASLRVQINKEEQRHLADKLIKARTQKAKAETDATIILTIFKLRELNNEASSTGIFGYRTWWLSKDTKTFRAVQKTYRDKYPVSCYMRPDFLYNHIALAPKRIEVDAMYKEIFPSLLGVNLSFHLPSAVTDYIQQVIAEHSVKNPVRVKAIIRKLSEKLKTDPSYRDINTVKLFLDEELHKMKA